MAGAESCRAEPLGGQGAMPESPGKRSGKLGGEVERIGGVSTAPLGPAEDEGERAGGATMPMAREQGLHETADGHPAARSFVSARASIDIVDLTVSEEEGSAPSPQWQRLVSERRGRQRGQNGMPIVHVIGDDEIDLERPEASPHGRVYLEGLRGRRTEAHPIVVPDSLPVPPQQALEGGQPGTGDRSVSSPGGDRPVLTCTICLDAVKRPASTTCGHLFCEACIKLAIKETKCCPSCRKKLRPTNVHRIYF